VDVKHEAPGCGSPALLYTGGNLNTKRHRRKGVSIMSTIYEEVKLEDLSPEEKLRGEAESEIEVPGVQKPESVEVRKEINPNTE
jgi:hypothetical protein